MVVSGVSKTYVWTKQSLIRSFQDNEKYHVEETCVLHE